jgi:hypothetical protein
MMYLFYRVLLLAWRLAVCTIALYTTLCQILLSLVVTKLCYKLYAVVR